MLHALEGGKETAIRRFADALDGRQLEGSGDVLTAVAGGSCWAGITLEETALKRVDAGDSIALVYPREGTSLLPDGSALVRGAPHPDNARAFLDFTACYDVQCLLAGQHRRSIRTDVPAADGLPNLSDLSLLDYNAEQAGRDRDSLLMTWAFYLGSGEEGQP